MVISGFLGKVIAAGLTAPLAALLTGPPAMAAPAGPPARQAPAHQETAYQACRSWTTHRPMAARMSSDVAAALATRVSLVAVRVDDPSLGIGCWLRGSQQFTSASVVKVTILGALLRRANAAQHRDLTQREKDLAWAMITRSDNDAATALWNEVGRYYLQRFLDLAKMTATRLGPDGYWGLTQITAHDEMLLLRLLRGGGHVLTAAACSYVLSLMAHVISSQRWGVPAGVPRTYTVHVKNGWLPTPPSNQWWVNSIGSFTSPGHDYSIVILTWRNPSMDYGVTTVEDVASVINHDLNPGAGAAVARTRPFPSWGVPDERIPWARPGLRPGWGRLPG